MSEDHREKRFTVLLNPSDATARECGLEPKMLSFRLVRDHQDGYFTCIHEDSFVATEQDIEDYFKQVRRRIQRLSDSVEACEAREFEEFNKKTKP